MVEISKLSRLIDGANRNISLSTNTIVVDNIKIRLGTLNSVTMAGSITSDRTITAPDANVDLGHILSLNSLSGVTAGDIDLGTFPGSVIPDNLTIKEALEEIENYIETNIGLTEFADTDFTIYDDADITKKIKFEAVNIAAGATRTITMPDEDVDLGDIKQDILNLQNITPAKEKHDMSTLPTNLTYIDLDHEAIELTLQVSVDRILLHEDDDYTITVEELTPGVFTTRLTWVNDIAIGGNQALDSTDVVRVKYYYQA